MGIYNSNFDFNKYRAFYAVAEAKSFSLAAELLHISQPAISYSIKELESQLDVKLFVRKGKNVSLTDKGKNLLTYVQNAFNNIIMAECSVNENKEELTGNIRIGIYDHLACALLPPLIKKFSQLHPKAYFDVYTSSTEELSHKLRNKEIDFMIVQYPVFFNEDTFTEEVIMELENCFFSAAKYYNLYMENHHNLVEYPILLPRRGFDDINTLEKLFKSKNMIIKNQMRIYAQALMVKLVKEDLGIGWGLKKVIEKKLESKELYEIPIDFLTPSTKFSISYDKRFLNETAIEFLNFLKSNIDDVIKTKK